MFFFEVGKSEVIVGTDSGMFFIISRNGQNIGAFGEEEENYVTAIEKTDEIIGNLCFFLSLW
jgi:hypothetical protein